MAVEVSPGTGKTWLIVKLVIARLLEGLSSIITDLDILNLNTTMAKFDSSYEVTVVQTLADIDDNDSCKVYMITHASLKTDLFNDVKTNKKDLALYMDEADGVLPFFTVPHVK